MKRVIEPRPTAVSIEIDRWPTAPGGPSHVVLKISTPTGVAVYFLSAQNAVSTGNALVREGQAVSLSAGPLIVVSGA